MHKGKGRGRVAAAKRHVHSVGWKGRGSLLGPEVGVHVGVGVVVEEWVRVLVIGLLIISVRY